MDHAELIRKNAEKHAIVQIFLLNCYLIPTLTAVMHFLMEFQKEFPGNNWAASAIFFLIFCAIIAAWWDIAMDEIEFAESFVLER
mgnify:FL=1